MATATASQSFEITFGSPRSKPPQRLLMLSKRKTLTKEGLIEKQKSAEERRKVKSHKKSFFIFAFCLKGIYSGKT